ncbi:hypothetical protein SAMN05192568_10638 [Methylobacterium pseudosasicola]|uniref:Uncharacterized protein n=1 Tax=Methylobacterium pseudosasicola TaxID=582667 RepID=A0A1I4U4K2_9HYPH|nr:hypothetical protein SAMN05192568_10638 [Methylobacterium pseudosasicola]
MKATIRVVVTLKVDVAVIVSAIAWAVYLLR